MNKNIFFNTSKLIHVTNLLIIVGLLTYCKPNIEQAKNIERIPKIIPDYTKIVIPPNIAPLNFYIDEWGIDYAVEFVGDNGKRFTIRSKNGTIKIPIRKWQELLKENMGKKYEVNVYVKNRNQVWNKYKSFYNEISTDSIDNYLAYRLINNGHVLWYKMGLYIRNLSNFEEKPIITNNLIQNDCVNCHSFWKNHTNKFLFHIRGQNRGTFLYNENKWIKLNTKTPYTMSHAVYPSWHPNGNLIAFSVNRINQSFHNYNDELIEVYDKASDLIVYDIEKNEITTCPEISTYNNETYPNWSADGKYLYYCMAPKWIDTIPVDSFRYSLMRISFDPVSKKWGKPDTIVSAYQYKKSVIFPRISPDGKYLMFCFSNHGCFSIFYPSSQLYILDLTAIETDDWRDNKLHQNANTRQDQISCYTNKIKLLPVNSDHVDSYHSWSSNSRWFVFSSKRINHIHTRPFFSYIDQNGNITKPFVLPMEDPHYFETFLKNYNVPELVKEPIQLSNFQIAKAIQKQPLNVSFDKDVNIDALSGATKINQK